MQANVYKLRASDATALHTLFSPLLAKWESNRWMQVLATDCKQCHCIAHIVFSTVCKWWSNRWMCIVVTGCKQCCCIKCIIFSIVCKWQSSRQTQIVTSECKQCCCIACIIFSTVQKWLFNGYVQVESWTRWQCKECPMNSYGIWNPTHNNMPSSPCVSVIFHQLHVVFNHTICTIWLLQKWKKEN